MLRAEATKDTSHPKLLEFSTDKAIVKEGALGALAGHGQGE
jgi:hypothetical protein